MKIIHITELAKVVAENRISGEVEEYKAIMEIETDKGKIYLDTKKGLDLSNRIENILQSKIKKVIL